MEIIRPATRWIIVALSISLGGTAAAETLQFPGGGPPVVQLASVATAIATSRPASLSDTTGRALTVSYDANGRLSAIKVGPRLNAFDLTAYYRSDGRIGYIRFGNGYDLRFEFDSTGIETVTDRFGNTLVRNPVGPRAYTTSSVTDQNGYLAATLERVDALFAAIAPTDGLSLATPSTASP